MFVVWKGDHTPRHVHVYRDGKLIAKWDLERRQCMQGIASVRVAKLLRQLLDEGLL